MNGMPRECQLYWHKLLHFAGTLRRWTRTCDGLGFIIAAMPSTNAVLQVVSQEQAMFAVCGRGKKARGPANATWSSPLRRCSVGKGRASSFEHPAPQSVLPLRPYESTFLYCPLLGQASPACQGPTFANSMPL